MTAPDARLETVARALAGTQHPTTVAMVTRWLGDPTPFDAQYVARAARDLPAEAASAALACLARHLDRPWAAFIREHVGYATDREAAWREALDDVVALHDAVRVRAWQRRAALAALAERPRMLLAARAAAVTSAKDVSNVVVRLLFFDGEEASVDALLPTVARVLATGDAKELAVLESYRDTAAPAARRLLDPVRAALRAKDEVFDLACVLFGEAAPRPLVARVLLFGEPRDAVVRVRLHGTREPALSVRLRTQRRAPERVVTFGAGEARDDLGLGAPEVAALPSWLARAGDLLGVAWRFDAVELRSTLAPSQQLAFLAWLAQRPL